MSPLLKLTINNAIYNHIQLYILEFNPMTLCRLIMPFLENS